MAFRRNPFEDLRGDQTAAVIVAHPDDETLWAGGTILAHPHWDWLIVSLCRGSDPDRAPKFRKALATLGAIGDMADLDDGPEQRPLQTAVIQNAVTPLLSTILCDVVVTHGPEGEYTRHRRHEEVSRAVCDLWLTGRLQARTLVMFAYEDGAGRTTVRDYRATNLPRPRPDAHFRKRLEQPLWEKKHAIITDLYGFAADSWEAQVTPREEAFWSFESKEALSRWLAGRGVTHEDSGVV